MSDWLVAGIDPGKNGGYAMWMITSNGPRFVEAGPLHFDDPLILYKTLDGIDEILIERAQSAPGQSNGFEYGRSFGRTEAACLMTGAKIYYCAASWWKAKMRVPTDKEAARQFALKTIPGLDKFVTLKKHDGIAEAALIAKLMTDEILFDALVKNNEKREAPKPKRTSFRL